MCYAQTQDKKALSTPSSLFQLSALLIKRKFVLLDELYPHVSIIYTSHGYMMAYPLLSFVYVVRY